MPRSVPLVLVLSLVAPGCWSEEIAPERPLTVELTVAKATAQVAEEIEFRAEATGRVLAGIVIRYDDGEADSLFAGGAQRAALRTKHAYADTGTYLVRAIAEEVAGGSAFDEASVRILP